LHNISDCLPGGKQKEYQHLRDLIGKSLMLLVFLHQLLLADPRHVFSAEVCIIFELHAHDLNITESEDEFTVQLLMDLA